MCSSHLSLARVMHVTVTRFGHLARFPRGGDEDLNVRTPCGGSGGWPQDLDVRVEADGVGWPLLELVETVAGREPGAARTARVAQAL